MERALSYFDVETGETVQCLRGSRDLSGHWQKEAEQFDAELKRWQEYRHCDKHPRYSSDGLLRRSNYDLEDKNYCQGLLNILLRLRKWRSYHHFRHRKMAEQVWSAGTMDQRSDEPLAPVAGPNTTNPKYLIDIDDLRNLYALDRPYQAAKDVLKWVAKEVETIMAETLEASSPAQVKNLEQQLLEDHARLEEMLVGVSGPYWRRPQSPIGQNRLERLINLENQILILQEEYWEWMENSEFIKANPAWSQEEQIAPPTSFFEVGDEVFWRRLVMRRKEKLDSAMSRRDCWLKYTNNCEQAFCRDDRICWEYWHWTDEKIVDARERGRLALEEVLEASRKLYEAQAAEARFHVQQVEQKENAEHEKSLHTPFRPSTKAQETPSLSSADQKLSRKRKADPSISVHPPAKRLVTHDIRLGSQETCPFVPIITKKKDLKRRQAVTARSRRSKTIARTQASVVGPSLQAPTSTVNLQLPDWFWQALHNITAKASVPFVNLSASVATAKVNNIKPPDVTTTLSEERQIMAKQGSANAPQAKHLDTDSGPAMTVRMSASASLSKVQQDVRWKKSKKRLFACDDQDFGGMKAKRVRSDTKCDTIEDVSASTILPEIPQEIQIHPHENLNLVQEETGGQKDNFERTDVVDDWIEEPCALVDFFKALPELPLSAPKDRHIDVFHETNATQANDVHSDMKTTMTEEAVVSINVSQSAKRKLGLSEGVLDLQQAKRIRSDTESEMTRDGRTLTPLSAPQSGMWDFSLSFPAMAPVSLIKASRFLDCKSSAFSFFPNSKGPLQKKRKADGIDECTSDNGAKRLRLTELSPVPRKALHASHASPENLNALKTGPKKVMRGQAHYNCRHRQRILEAFISA